MEMIDFYAGLFDALSHPMRLKILNALSNKRMYVSELAVLLDISRPLLYMHIKKLEEADIVIGSYEISSSGKSMKYYDVKPFNFHITPDFIRNLTREAKPIPVELL